MLLCFPARSLRENTTVTPPTLRERFVCSGIRQSAEKTTRTFDAFLLICNTFLKTHARPLGTPIS